MSRTGWSIVLTVVVLFLAWWGLRMLWWRMNYMIPAFGVGLLCGVALTLWLGGWPGRRRRSRSNGPSVS